MTKTISIIIFLNITLFKLHHFPTSTARETDSSDYEIFRGHRSSVAPDEYFRAHLESNPLRRNGTRISGDNLTQSSSQEVTNTTGIYNDILAFPGVDIIKVFDENDQALQHPLSLVLQKISRFFNYLTHPNVALTPLYLLSMLKRKFVQHLRDKLGGDTQEYPYPYRF